MCAVHVRQQYSVERVFIFIYWFYLASRDCSMIYLLNEETGIYTGTGGEYAKKWKCPYWISINRWVYQRISVSHVIVVFSNNPHNLPQVLLCSHLRRQHLQLLLPFASKMCLGKTEALSFCLGQRPPYHHLIRGKKQKITFSHQNTGTNFLCYQIPKVSNKCPFLAKIATFLWVITRQFGLFSICENPTVQKWRHIGGMKVFFMCIGRKHEQRDSFCPRMYLVFETPAEVFVYFEVVFMKYSTAQQAYWVCFATPWPNKKREGAHLFVRSYTAVRAI